MITSLFTVAAEPKGKSFEDILDDIGAFGHWQRVIFVLISLADIQGAFAILSPVFVHAVPEWRCLEWEDGLTEPGREDWNKECFRNGSDVKCVAYEFYDDFTSVVSEVSMQRIVVMPLWIVSVVRWYFLLTRTL